MRVPWIPNRRLARALGWIFLGLALICLYDAYERRGERAPRILQPILPF
jgi:hypothetical protein